MKHFPTSSTTFPHRCYSVLHPYLRRRMAYSVRATPYSIAMIPVCNNTNKAFFAATDDKGSIETSPRLVNQARVKTKTAAAREAARRHDTRQVDSKIASASGTRIELQAILIHPSIHPPSSIINPSASPSHRSSHLQRSFSSPPLHPNTKGHYTNTPQKQDKPTETQVMENKPRSTHARPLSRMSSQRAAARRHTDSSLCSHVINRRAVAPTSEQKKQKVSAHRKRK